VSFGNLIEIMKTTTFITSRDGTTIAATCIGKGANLVLVDGAFCHRNFGPNKALAEHLKNDFTVITYDRRGRGESSNSLPYAVEREIEDLEAVIAHFGESAYVYGISSGAALVLSAAKSGVKTDKLALYEVPFIIDNSRKPLPGDYVENLKAFTDRGQTGKAVSYFMSTGVGLPAFVVMMMRLMPAWKKLKHLAPTAVYDALILGDKGSGKHLNVEEWSSVTAKTAVICGGKSAMWMRNAMKELVAMLPDAIHVGLEGQSHIVKPGVLAPELIKFFKGG
jgi:pimeloyl-ACP methyl ester carboxylesterase